MKKLLIILLVLEALTFSYAEKRAAPAAHEGKGIAKKLAELPEVEKPEKFAVIFDRLYIAAKTTVYMYGMKDFKFMKQFVEKGYGPGEIDNIEHLKAYPEFLSMELAGNKIMFFSLDGEFIEEFKTPQHTYRLSPFGNKFVGIVSNLEKRSPNRYYTLNILNRNFKSIDRLYRGGDFAIQTKKGKKKKVIDLFSHNFLYDVYKDKFFVVDTRKGFYIVVLNKKGKRLHEINKDYKKIKIPQALKDQTMDIYKNHPGWSNLKAKFQFAFPDFFPAVHRTAFRVTDDKIYVFTNETRGEGKNKERELAVLDLKGKILKKIFLPVPGETAPDLRSKSYIHGHTYYYLLENEDRKVWALHAVELK